MNPRYLTTPATKLGWTDIREGLAQLMSTAVGSTTAVLAYLGAKTTWDLDILPTFSATTTVSIVVIISIGVAVAETMERYRYRRFNHRHPLVERLLDAAEVFCPACRTNRMPITHITCDDCEQVRKTEPVNGLYHHANGTTISADPDTVSSWYAARSARIDGVDAAANTLQPNKP